jgi:hypothetical protein
VQEGDTNVGGSWSMTFRITSSDAPEQPVGDTFDQVYLFPFNATVPTAVGRHREDLISADSALGS